MHFIIIQSTELLLFNDENKGLKRVYFKLLLCFSLKFNLALKVVFLFDYNKQFDKFKVFDL